MVGLARAAQVNKPTSFTHRTMLEGLFTTLTNVNFDDEAVRRQIESVRNAKNALLPQCACCGVPCANTDDYDMEKLWNDNEDIRSLKSLILFGLRGMAAYAYHALVLGYTDEEVNNFFLQGYVCDRRRLGHG